MAGFTHILAATDFTEAGDAALAHGRTLAQTLGASLDVLHVAPDLSAGVMGIQGFEDDLGRIQTESEEAARRHIRGMLTDGDRRDLSARAVVLTSAKPADAILGYARDEGIDLIVVGAHAHGRVAQLMLGSVAEKVLRGAKCAVLTVRGPGETSGD